MRSVFLRKLYLGAEPFLFAPLNILLRSQVTRLGRSLAAQKYLTGSGLEIGAFVSPTLAPLGVGIRYVDRVPASHWRSEPQYQHERPVEPDLIDDGAKLTTVQDASVDFVVAFHVLEHLPNAMEAVRNWIRVTRKGGVLLVAVPDKRFTHDARREVTPSAHFLRDFEEGPAWGAADHYRDVARNVRNLPERDAEAFVEDAPPAIHFHVWDLNSFFMFWHQANTYFGEPLEILEVRLNRHEVLAVLRRRH
jgi:SAM-dependent methyltransferase